jgi:release factor glutamine methyltransferase
MPLKILLKSAADVLRQTSQTPLLDAEILLAHVLQKPRSFLQGWPLHQIDDATEQHFLGLIKKRQKGWPVAYLTGFQPFWSFNLTVDQSTLIPRPETEHLVELALEKLDKNTTYQIADLGTGSGAVGLAIAKERPHSQIFATDMSESALKVASGNASRLGIKNIRFYQGDWCMALPNQFYDLIVSNPPYVAAHEALLLSAETRFEPAMALFAKENGLKDIGCILNQVPFYLKPGGYVLVEHGFSQGEQVRSLFEKAGFTKVFTEQDYSGHERVTGGVLY